MPVLANAAQRSVVFADDLIQNGNPLRRFADAAGVTVIGPNVRNNQNKIYPRPVVLDTPQCLPLCCVSIFV